MKFTGRLGETFDYKIDYDDHQFFAAVTVPVKVFFSAFREAVYRDPEQSVSVATSVNRNGALFCSGKLFRDDKGGVVWDILEQAETIEDLPEFKQAYGLWQQRAEAFNRAEEAHTKAATLNEHLHEFDKPGHRLRLSSLVISHHHFTSSS